MLTEHTAQIIQFPARGRFTPTGQSQHTAAAAEQFSEVTGGSWYHEAAIRESKLAGER